ncbi:Lsb5p NDAI_0A00410 [Naumovozyma dairenensis CBS 421]|uniref:VHS domain-containing protein n=1 Tax=Naumovozyma dairenensis (strain ATCC 10597 / BCRC 20456 / CBS 421 / NBRC 0211 / NRRL Y-12639) TaxID=1071378 RepID=G0W311_NAUDC|nr:hypothetical protein NDAI_0A00410 [Naumovozyma dairenensis CBS 421]CCD22199.1 hypothetical protein NDAI_0A00410 [Naumovozyma dairenensis CBS 421]
MGFLTDHPHTAISEIIFRIVSSEDYPLEVELTTLIDLIDDNRKANDYNYTINQEEAARAIRKRLKYGNSIQQNRSLDLLDLIITQNIKYSTLFNDTKLLKLLESIAKSDDSKMNLDTKFVKRTISYMKSWNSYLLESGLSNSRCFHELYLLSNDLKNQKIRTTSNSNTTNKTKKQSSRTRSRTRSKKSNFLNDSADESVYTSSPFGSSSTTIASARNQNKTTLQNADRKYRIPHIDLKKEGPKISLIISNSLAAAVALQNSLIILPKDANALDDENATKNFIKARAIRRKVLRYLQLVTEGEFLGSLLYANDELVKALTLYDERSFITDNSDSYSDEEDSLANYDSDSDSDIDSASNSDDADRYNTRRNVTPPSKPIQKDDDPFGDANII